MKVIYVTSPIKICWGRGPCLKILSPTTFRPKWSTMFPLSFFRSFQRLFSISAYLFITTNTPAQVGGGWNHSQLSQKISMKRTVEWHSGYTSGLKGGSNKLWRNQSDQELLSDKMIVMVNVFHLFTKHRILGDMNHSLAVQMEKNRLWNWNGDIIKKVNQPYKFCVTRHIKRYSASVELREMDVCFFDFQEVI